MLLSGMSIEYQEISHHTCLYKNAQRHTEHTIWRQAFHAKVARVGVEALIQACTWSPRTSRLKAGCTTQGSDRPGGPRWHACSPRARLAAGCAEQAWTPPLLSRNRERLVRSPTWSSACKCRKSSVNALLLLWVHSMYEVGVCACTGVCTRECLCLCRQACLVLLPPRAECGIQHEIVLLHVCASAQVQCVHCGLYRE
jgi:hypothetical protein